MNLEELTQAVLERMAENKPRAYLIGEPPENYHNYNYVNEEPYEAVVLGVLSPGELLHMPDDTVCRALLEGKAVWLWPHQRHHGVANARLLCRELTAAEQHLKQLGVRVMGQERPLITAQAARLLRQAGERPEPGSRLTPLAKDILEGREP